MAEYFNMDSFGSDCPANREEIAAWLSDKFADLYPDYDSDNWEDREHMFQFWEDFCNGRFYAEGCPTPVF